MVSWMKQRKGVKTQMHFSNNWIRYCSIWEAVVAGGEKCNGWGHCTTGFPIPQSHAADFAGVLRDWKDPVSSSLKTSMESLKRLVRISLTVQESTLVQYFPGYSHLSAMLPISESAEDFVSLLAFQHSHPSVPELCSALLLFPSHSLSDVVLHSALFVSFHSGVPGFLFSMSSLSTSREFLRHICQDMCLPCSPWTPIKLLYCLCLSWIKSLSISLLPPAGLDGQLESKTSFPAQLNGETPLLPHCHYFPPEVTHKLLWVFKWAVISSFHQHSLTLDSQCRFSFNGFIGMTGYTGDAKVDNLIHQALLSFFHLHHTVSPFLFAPPQLSFLSVFLCLSVCLPVLPCLPPSPSDCLPRW